MGGLVSIVSNNRPSIMDIVECGTDGSFHSTNSHLLYIADAGNFSPVYKGHIESVPEGSEW